jgi:hypothetical protein
MRVAAVVVLIAIANGCGYSFDVRAAEAYREGRYLDTAERLARHERELPSIAQARRARYGLFRGLAALRLGDRGEAARWLGYAYEMERTAPTLPADQRLLLDAGWRELALHATR